MADADALRNQVNGLAAVVPVSSKSVTLVAMSRNWSAGVTGTSRDWFSAGKWQIASGRVFNEAEERAGAAVCVIGETVRRELFGGLDPVGRMVQLSSGHTLSYDVLAVNLEPLIDRAAVEAELPGARQNAMFMHPLEGFGQLWPQLEAMAQQQPMHVAIIGHDLHAAELAMCAAQGLWEPQGSRVSLLTHGLAPFADAPPRLQNKVLARLK